ncbi:DUF2971 domain-containing protein [Moritella sp. JT01]|uniref:DUF2971 domain-containing protein n=1 Tax=Moritella sp. JT01 TaxID=756698 RepID=UPI000AA73D4E|nr:DUF2971 domain-containing protein [Moritella sp. JT01]
MSQDVALKFISNPVLRVTPRWALNDPFECKLANTTNEQLNSLNGSDDLNIHFESFMGLHGIVSLSETPDNLLMWSHYAQEHKGAVVEFFIDETDPLSIFNISKCPISSDAKLGKVNYRKRRNYPFNVDAESLEPIRTHYYLTKSDEWIYEKEHRFIIPATEANYMKSEKCSKYNYDENGLALIGSSLGASEQLQLWKDSKETGAMFFASVNPKKIGRFIIGCDADLELYKTAMIEAEHSYPYRSFADSISNKFRGVEISKLHSERFELFFEPLNTEIHSI